MEEIARTLAQGGLFSARVVARTHARTWTKLGARLRKGKEDGARKMSERGTQRSISQILRSPQRADRCSDKRPAMNITKPRDESLAPREFPWSRALVRTHARIHVRTHARTHNALPYVIRHYIDVRSNCKYYRRTSSERNRAAEWEGRGSGRVDYFARASIRNACLPEARSVGAK